MLRRKKLVLLVAIAMVVAVLPGTALAGEKPGETVYLSLGTSLAAGSLADADGVTTFSSNVSYTDQLYQRLRGRYAPNLEHVKLGCPGETTDQMIGGVNAAGQASNCAGLYATGSQMGDALATIATEDVRLITIDMGVNDALQVQVACDFDPACIIAAIPGIAANVAGIIVTVRGSGYTGPIVAANYYNASAVASIGFYAGLPGPLTPDLEIAIGSDLLIQGFNGALEAAYAATGVPVADVYSAFNSGDFGDDRPANGIPDNADRICSLTFMCPSEDGVLANIHANKRGYGVMARTLFRVVVAHR